MKLRSAIVGAGIGGMHADHLRRLRDRFEAVLICDLNEQKAAVLARAFNVAEVEQSYDAVLERADIDVVHICTPPNLHFAQTQAALDAGKHVVCEKPLVGSLREIDALAQAARTAGLHVLPVMQMRAGDGLRRVAHLNRRGVLGRHVVSTVETAWRRGSDYYDAAPWRGRWSTELGGCLTTQAIHTHDMLMQVLGPPKTVFAQITTRLNPAQTEDLGLCQFTFADGSFASSVTTLASAEEITRFRMVFECATVESGLDPYQAHKGAWRIVPESDRIGARIRDAGADYIAGPEDLSASLIDLHEAVAKGSSLGLDLGAARQSLEVLTAAYSSVLTGAPKRLPIQSDDPLYHGWTSAMANRPIS